MSGTEVSPAARDVLLDAHVGVAEANDDGPSGRVLHIDGGLLRTTRCPERFVEGDFLALVVGHAQECPR